MGFYVVKKGFKTGIYDTWDECKRHIEGYSKAVYKKFKTIEEARYYFDTGKVIEESGTIIMNSTKVTFTQSDRKQRKGYLEVWTDGSCLANGKKNSSGGCGVFFGDNDSRNISEALSIKDKPHTNQKGELRAISLALKVILRMKGEEEKHVTIYTDSQYSMNCIEKWGDNWEKNGWKTVGGQQVKNLELIQKAIKRYKKAKSMYKSIKFKHINSHTKMPSDKKSKEYQIWYGNEQADILAKKSAVNNK